MPGAGEEQGPLGITATGGFRRLPHDGEMPDRSLEREGLGEDPNPSLCGGSTVPSGRSLWPVSGSTPRFTVAHRMERHPAGSQRPDALIRFLRFEVHGYV